MFRLGITTRGWGIFRGFYDKWRRKRLPDKFIYRFYLGDKFIDIQGFTDSEGQQTLTVDAGGAVRFKLKGKQL